MMATLSNFPTCEHPNIEIPHPDYPIVGYCPDCKAIVKVSMDKIKHRAIDRIRAEMEEARAVPATEKYAAGLLRALEILQNEGEL